MNRLSTHSLGIYYISGGGGDISLWYTEFSPLIGSSFNLQTQLEGPLSAKAYI